jgi:O-antigen/teichoic acid export membrane protein
MWHKLVRNALSNVGGTMVGLAVGFVTMPLLVHHLGPAEFGLWVLASSLVGYLGVLDLGLSPTLVNAAAALLARDEPAARERLSETASTIFTTYAVLGALGGTALVLVGLMAGALFQVPPDDLTTFRLVLLVVGLQTALNLPMSVWNGLLSGLQAFHVTNAIGVVTTLVRGGLTVALVLAGQGLVTIVGASFAATLGAWAASCWCAHRRIPGLRVRLGGFRRERLGEIGRFSFAMVVWTISGASLHQLDRVLIGAMLPVAALTTYEVGGRLSMYSRSLLYSWLAVVMPATSTLVARGERGRVRALFLRGTRYVLATYGGVAVGLIGLGGPFVRLWMGEEFDESYAIMCLLVVGNLWLSQNVVAHVMLPGMRELRVFTRFMGVYAVVAAVCAVTGIVAGGIVGLAAGVATAMLVMEVAFLVVVVRRRFDVTFPHLFARCHLPVLKALAPVALAIVGARALVAIESWAALVAVAMLAGVVFCGAVWTSVLTPAERRAVRRRFVAGTRMRIAMDGSTRSREAA